MAKIVKLPKYRLLYYYRNNYSNIEISNIFNCSPDYIIKKLKEFGVYKNKKLSNTSFKDAMSIVKSLKRKGYSDNYISLFIKDGYKKPYKYIKEFTKRTESDNLNILTNKEKSLIVGTFLGDGNITKNNVFNFSHTVHQEKYFYYKLDLIKGLNKTVTKSKRIYANPTVKDSQEYKFCSNSTNDFIKFIYTNSYTPKKKITKEILKYYDDLSLAIHFMDDGSKCKSYIFCTESFDIDSLKLLINHLKTKFDLNFTIHSNNRIYLLKKDIVKFNDIVDSHICESMKYKLHNYAE